MVTHAHQTVTTHAHRDSKFIIVQVAKATEAFVGIVNAIAAALLSVTTFHASVNTRV